MSDMITIKDDETGRVQAIMKRAAEGDTSVLPELRQDLDDNPALWRYLGNLATRAEMVWISLVSGNHLAASESLHRFLDTLKLDLVGPSPTPAIRLQSELVALSWLQLHHADLLLADLCQQSNVPSRRLESVTRRQQQFQRGYQKALAVLETLKRLVPAPQVPDGGGSPRSSETPMPEISGPGAVVLPVPTTRSNSADPGRRIAAQHSSVEQTEPYRRAL